MKCTKEQPGYFSDMLKEIARLENTSPTKTLHFKNLESARKAKYKLTSMLFNIDGNKIMCLGSTTRVGSLRVLLFNEFEIPFDSYTGEIEIEVSKSLKDYTTKPRGAGQYKYCEGGGWYSMASLYELNGKYYTDAY